MFVQGTVMVHVQPGRNLPQISLIYFAFCEPVIAGKCFVSDMTTVLCSGEKSPELSVEVFHHWNLVNCMMKVQAHTLSKTIVNEPVHFVLSSYGCLYFLETLFSQEFIYIDC